MKNYSTDAINTATGGLISFCKFLSANDTGETGGHQAGIYISKPAIPILFSEPGKKGENKEKWVRIIWQGGELKTDSRFIYYGKGTRNEYRITNFGRGFPYLTPEYTGALFVLVKESPEDYQGYILNSEEEIQNFLDAFGLTPQETNNLIDTGEQTVERREETAIQSFINSLTEDFPSSYDMSDAARIIWYQTRLNRGSVLDDPDKVLLEWTDKEYRLFRAIEHDRYGDMISEGFENVDDFIMLANKVLNRRKSRAGKSLEHHLAALFDENDISYTAQAITEGNKKPDFIFPSEQAYHDLNFNVEDLVSLAAKTTCKDRWRQVINEADRLRDQNKYLCTMQQGISSAQMDEMEAERVVLVVPKPYIKTYPKDKQHRIWSLKQFIDYVREKEGII